MKQIDYFRIVHKYIPPDTKLYRIYIPHAVLVTRRAYGAGQRLGLSDESLVFIEEAGILHDIGIISINAPELYCTGNLNHYVCHGPEGRRILEEEGLPKHALVAERHVGTGITLTDIIRNKLPLPERDMCPETIEEKIICWADLFYRKNPDMTWKEKTPADIEKKLSRYGERCVKTFKEWQELFA